VSTTPERPGALASAAGALRLPSFAFSRRLRERSDSGLRLFGADVSLFAPMEIVAGAPPPSPAELPWPEINAIELVDEIEEIEEIEEEEEEFEEPFPELIVNVVEALEDDDSVKLYEAMHGLPVPPMPEPRELNMWHPFERRERGARPGRSVLMAFGAIIGEWFKET
jgi:hypothetical protein